VSPKNYTRFVNFAAVAAVAAAFLYDRIGSYGWVALGAAALSALAGAVSYFRFHWQPTAAQSTDENGTAIDDARIVDADRTVTHFAEADLAAARLALEATVFAPGSYWRARRYTREDLGALLAELERHQWSVSGTLRICPAGAKDAVVSLYFEDGTVRPVKTYGRYGAAKHKQALSKADFPPIARSSARVAARC
jgi:hypothetical protein